MDGYGSTDCTKSAIRKVRASKYASQKIAFDLDMNPVKKQEEFFGTETNKIRFISNLINLFGNTGYISLWRCRFLYGFDCFKNCSKVF